MMMTCDWLAALREAVNDHRPFSILQLRDCGGPYTFKHDGRYWTMA